MNIGGKLKEPKRKAGASTQMISYSIPKNLELNALNANEVKLVYCSQLNNQDWVLMQYLNKIRIVSLSEMKVERDIEEVPGKIDLVGAYSEGVYWVTSDRRDYWMYLYNWDVVSEPLIVALESRILAHKAFEFEDRSLIVMISVDKYLRVYDVSNWDWKLLIEKQIYSLSQTEVDSISIYEMIKSKWIWVVINHSTLIYVSIEDWHWTYPIAGEIFNIFSVVEYSHYDDFWAIIWDDYNEGEDGKRHPIKMMSLIKMPPENDEGTYEIQNHKIPGGDWIDILDCASIHQSILILWYTNQIESVNLN